MFLQMSQTITFSHLFKTDYPVPDGLPKAQSKLQIQSQKSVFYFDLFLFSSGRKTTKNRQASVIYYLWWFSWTAAGACNKDVVIHHKESVDS